MKYAYKMANLLEGTVGADDTAADGTAADGTAPVQPAVSEFSAPPFFSVPAGPRNTLADPQYTPRTGNVREDLARHERELVQAREAHEQFVAETQEKLERRDAENAELNRLLVALRATQQKALQESGANALRGKARQILMWDSLIDPLKKTSVSWRGSDYVLPHSPPREASPER